MVMTSSSNKGLDNYLKVKVKKILVINQNNFDNMLLKSLFSKYHCLFTFNSNMPTVVKDIETKEYDLILIDLTENIAKGFELAKIINKSDKNKNVPFVFMSNIKTSKLKANAYKVGVRSFFELPLNTDIVQAQIKNIINIREFHEKLFIDREHLENIMKFSTNQHIITDKNFIVLNSGISLLKLKKDDNFLESLKNKNIEIDIEKILKYNNSSDKILYLDLSYKKSVEENYYYKATFSKIYNEMAILQGFYVVIADITEEILLEKQKETFIATLTHDLKTPILAQSQALDLILKGSFGKLNDEQKEIILEVKNSCCWVKRMITNLLLRYKYSLNGLDLVLDEVNLKGLLESCINHVKYIIQSKQQKLKVNYKTAHLNVIVDEIEFSRVINNIIINATEYTDVNGSITITVRNDVNNVIIDIEDNGIGMEEADCQDIFNKYRSLSKKFRNVGSGLGLYISKKIVEAHGGSITVKSTPDVGSIFSIFIPILNIQQQIKIKDQMLK